MNLAAILFFFIPGERVHVAALLTLKAKWFASLTKTMEIMMNKVVLIFSPSDQKTPYEQGENQSYVRTVQSVAARSIVHKFLKRSSACAKPERVSMGLL